ncbi:DUF402 domain-containing protein, partial [bacterium]|nr:DUF402 domain-containing protein [bacterium]
MPSDITIIKQNSHGEETWRYTGQVLKQTADAILIQARFNREDSVFEGIPLKKGDPFIEAFYTRHWFNVFEMRDRESSLVKGWYCNVSRPAVINDSTIAYADLALDLLVYPNGDWKLLDEGEYAALDLSAADQAQAQQAVSDLQRLFSLGADFD